MQDFLCLPVDQSPSKTEIQLALKSDIIYLAGGNTFYFLKHLQESGMMPHLKRFAERGGVLAGLSAGGLIMSPTVALAADQGLGPDENEVKQKDFQGLGLFPFEFSPHFEKSKKQIQAHLAYSKKTTHPIWAVEDGSGIVINGNEISLMGTAEVYFRGNRVVL